MDEDMRDMQYDAADAQDDDADDEPAPRVRRASAKQAQLIQDMQAADARKAEKAQKAEKTSKKRALKAAGLDDDEVMEPRPDNQFTSRTVESRPKTTKALAQRDGKIPPPPPKFPNSSWRETVSSSSSTSTYRARDDRDMRDHRGDGYYSQRQDRRSRSRSPVYFRGRSPAPPPRAPSPPRMYNINGGRVPNDLTLNLHHSDDERDEEDDLQPRPSRSPSPTPGDKRRRSPEGDEDTLRVVQAQRTSTSTGRPKAKDFDDVTQELLALAIKLYRCCLGGKNPFPPPATELEFVRDVWAAACKMLNISMQLTPTLSKLITIRGTHFRGEGKTKIRPIVEVGLNFKSGQDKKTIAYNRQRAEDLKENNTFTFKDLEARKGMYRSPLIQQAINGLFFANRRDEGPTFPDVFNPFPKEGFAFVLATFINCIDEWATGVRVDIPFTANEYRSVYEAQLQALLEFEEQTQKYKILDNIRVRLHNIGRFHSGAQPLAAVSKSVLKQDDIAAAIKEYEEDEETESEGEFGDRATRST
ncbi:hypothetical protein B0H16DRAFT_243727 [Mycena metata]|nr:hypothetical protein B0H16DRAFT_243727 [Mycena metata]